MIAENDNKAWTLKDISFYVNMFGHHYEGQCFANCDSGSSGNRETKNA